MAKHITRRKSKNRNKTPVEKLNRTSVRAEGVKGSRGYCEDRVDQTERNLRNRALRKLREYWGVKYPGKKKADWPAKIKQGVVNG